MSAAVSDIRIEVMDRLGLITLDRGRALNALTHEMIAAIGDALDDWEGDARIAHIVIRSADEKAFSAGGDLRGIYDLGLAAKRGEGPLPTDFFQGEYRLNARIKTYPKPYIALINGIVMGGGVGVSINGRYRIAGENVLFAMPEVGIGFFPDVGGTFFLPRLPGETGIYLGLTGSRIGLGDCLWTGLASQFVPGERFDEVIDALAGSADTGRILEKFDIKRDCASPSIAADAGRIDRVFAQERIADIRDELERWQDEGSERAAAAAKAIGRASPTSLAIALRQMRIGRTLDFADCMKTEYRIVSRVLAGHDFYEGVRAQIIDKDRTPKWDPANLDDVSDAAIATYFAPLKEELDLT
jgi:enoyl-CoA hydratase